MPSSRIDGHRPRTPTNLLNEVQDENAAGNRFAILVPFKTTGVTMQLGDFSVTGASSSTSWDEVSI
ncbi:hypothetical protein ACLOJK_012745 [Asimina triloba]